MHVADVVVQMLDVQKRKVVLKYRSTQNTNFHKERWRLLHTASSCVRNQAAQ